MACSYKIMTNGKPAERIRRRFYASIGETSPPIDTYVFRGAVPVDLKTNTRTYKNGKIDGTEYHPNGAVVGLLIKVIDYDSSGPHSVHAISAVKIGTTLYGFNSWGASALPIDKKIFRKLATLYKCKKIQTYNGYNLQYGNQHGVCVGFASNFVLEILTLNHYHTKIGRTISTTFPDDMTLYNTLSTSGRCFGEGPICTLTYQRSRMAASLKKTVLTPIKKRKLKNIEVNTSPTYVPYSPLPEKAIPLRKYASTHCIKGYSKYTKKSNLAQYIQKYNATKKIPFNQVKQLTAIDLRKYAGKHCVKGKSKTTKKENLLKLVKDALY